MSLLLTFIENQFLKSLEEDFVKQEPAIQQAIVDEVNLLAQAALRWVENKLNPQKSSPGALP